MWPFRKKQVQPRPEDVVVGSDHATYSTTLDQWEFEIDGLSFAILAPLLAAGILGTLCALTTPEAARSVNNAIVRRAKQGASCQVKDLMFQNLASRNYRVLQ